MIISVTKYIPRKYCNLWNETPNIYVFLGFRCKGTTKNAHTQAK